MHRWELPSPPVAAGPVRARRRRLPRSLRALAAALLAVALVAAGSPAGAVDPPPTEITADGETTPVAVSGDAADDPAIWVHSTDPARSVVIGNAKSGGLETYDLSGARIQRISEGFFGNVDVRYRFPLGNSTVDLVGVSRQGVRLYSINPTTRLLTNVTDGGSISSSGEGFCLYRSPVSGRFYAFHVARDGVVRQIELRDADADGLIDGRLVRTWDVGTESEGCVADDDLAHFYVSEEDVGIWKYGAEPGAGTSTIDRVQVDKVGSGGHLVADVEGLAIVRQSNGTGYLMASAQAGTDNPGGTGNSFVAVYQRQGSNQFLSTFRVVTGLVTDGCTMTDGIEAVAANLGPRFPFGLFVCQDHTNTLPGSSGNQNYKLARLEKAVALESAPPPLPPPPPPPVIRGISRTPSGAGYWMVAADGRVFNFGDTGDFGELASPPSTSIVGMAATPTGLGYWLVDSKGKIFRFGDAGFFGDASSIPLNQPIVGMAAHPGGAGYWLVASDGGVFTFGNANFFGSMGGKPLNQPMVGMSANPSGAGYRLVASDGGVFCFGDAGFFGSTGSIRLNRPMVGMDTTPNGAGYWLVAADGGVFTFGNAGFFGSTGSMPPEAPGVGMASTPNGGGYWLVASDGDLFTFGNAMNFGSP